MADTSAPTCVAYECLSSHCRVVQHGDNGTEDRRSAWAQEYADRRMRMDAEQFARGTHMLCPFLDEKVLCAIADFSCSLGLGRLKASMLRRKLNAGDIGGAALNYANG